MLKKMIFDDSERQKDLSNNIVAVLEFAFLCYDQSRAATKMDGTFHTVL